MNKETSGRRLSFERLPNEIAEHVVGGNGLPKALSARPDTVLDSAEVALELSDQQNSELIRLMEAVDDKDLDRIVEKDEFTGSPKS